MASDDIPLSLAFEDGDGPEVVTGVFCHRFGGCESCPGILTARQAGLELLDPDETVFCVHTCHQDAPEV